MTITRVSALAAFFLLLGTDARGDDVSADEILEKVVAAYKDLKTYKAEGTITSVIETGGRKNRSEFTFSILLQKPNSYLVSWVQKEASAPSMIQSGAIWNEGTQPYLYSGVGMGVGMHHRGFKMPTDVTSFAYATGISGGAVVTIPRLFLPMLDSPAPFSWLKNPRIETTEEVGGEDCYVLSGSSATSEKETFWVSKTRYLIRKYYKSPDPDEENPTVPTITDEQLERVIECMGEELTEENMESLREMMGRSKIMFEATKTRVSKTEVYTDVSSPGLDKEDFRFSLPVGTVLRDFPFDGRDNE